MKLNVKLNLKNTRTETDECVVDKTIFITERDYDYFSNHLLEDQSFIKENADWMRVDSDGVAHCLLVFPEEGADGILVCSEGAPYARYSAQVPKAKLIYLEEQKALYDLHYPNAYEKEREFLIEKILKEGEDGRLQVNLSDFARQHLKNAVSTVEFLTMLTTDERIQDIEVLENGKVNIQLNQQDMKERPRHFFTQEEVDIMCAKHMLWIYDEGGRQADFSGGNLVGLNLDNKNLNSALFKDVMINGCTFKDAGLCFSDFANSSISNSFFDSADAEEANFSNVEIMNCFFRNASFTHSDFSNSKVSSSNFTNSNFENACTDRMEMDDMSERHFSSLTDNSDETQDVENVTPNLSM